MKATTKAPWSPMHTRSMMCQRRHRHLMWLTILVISLAPMVMTKQQLTRWPPPKKNSFACVVQTQGASQTPFPQSLAENKIDGARTEQAKYLASIQLLAHARSGSCTVGREAVPLLACLRFCTQVSIHCHKLL